MTADGLISGLTIHTPETTLRGGALRVQGQVISEIFAAPPAQFNGKRYNFPSNYHLVPGRIDLHIHGAQGADVMDATPAALGQIRSALAAEGVTGFLATTVTESPEKIERALNNVAQYQQNCHAHAAGARILGIHLEGPFISPRQKGAHRQEWLLPPDPDLFDHWQACADQHIQLVTVAPELPGGIEFIRHLRQRQVRAAIGHTDADYALTELAIAAGVVHATHLFNAMRGFHHREPGCVGALLTNNQVLAELIADGHHCHAAALRLALSMKGRDGVVLVSDAMRAKCCAGSCSFDLGGQQVWVENGAARLSNGVLAGSVLTMTQAVKNVLRWTGCTLTDAIYFTSVNPAKALGLYDETGSITTGKHADLTVLNDHLEVVLTISQGKIVYAHSIT